MPFPNNTESWASGVTNSVPSTVSSPASSGTPDEYVAPYLPTSAPAGLISPTGNGHRGGQEIKMEYEDGNGMYIIPYFIQENEGGLNRIIYE